MYRWAIAILMFGMLGSCIASSLSISKDFTFQEGSDTGLIVMSTRMIDNANSYGPYGPIELKLSYGTTVSNEKNGPVCRW